MARDDQIEFDGVVSAEPGGGMFIVRVKEDHDVVAKLCGKMREHKIRVVLGDKVTVAVSPYDLTKGRITHRVRGDGGGPQKRQPALRGYR